ncbi:MAG: hypothetical protein KDC53_10545 [Saprospiraceae bacterium]|nr:hypothetical protein [Saprospiraceae bacterium]
MYRFFSNKSANTLHAIIINYSKIIRHDVFKFQDIYISVVFILQSIFVGCRSDDVENPLSNNQSLSNAVINEHTDQLYFANLQDYNDNIFEVIDKSIDQEEVQMDYLLYFAADALKENIRNNIFNRKIIELAGRSPNQTCNIPTLLKELPEVKLIVSEKLLEIQDKILAKAGKAITSLEEIDKNLIHTNPQTNITRKYDLSIFVPNLTTLDPAKHPIFSPNLPVNEEEHPELDDHIVAWYYDENGNFHQTTIGEEEAMSSTNPIFIIDNAALLNLTKIKKERANPNPRTARSITSFHTHEYQIFSSFELTGNSEVHVAAAGITSSGTAINILHPGNQFTGTYIADKEIDEVPSSGIGQPRTKWSQLFNLVNYQNDDAVFWNVFERDWSRSSKWLGDGDAYGETVQLDGNRKYWDDVYLYDRDAPGQLQDDWDMMDIAYINGAVWIFGTIPGTSFNIRLWKVTQ